MHPLLGITILLKGLRLMLGASVHIEAVSGLELLATLITADQLAHMSLYVIPHVLPDIAQFATHQALQTSFTTPTHQGFNLLIQSSQVGRGLS